MKRASRWMARKARALHEIWKELEYAERRRIEIQTGLRIYPHH